MAASAAALPLLAVGCKGVAALGPPPKPSAEVVMLRSAIVAEAAMVARYTAAVSRYGGDRGGQALATVLAQHQQHLSQLRARLTGRPADTARAAKAAGQQLAGTSRAGAFTLLEHAEQAASDWLLSQLRLCSPSLAQLMASICAAEAGHVPYLDTAARP